MRYPLSNYFFLFYMSKKITSKNILRLTGLLVKVVKMKPHLKQSWEALRGALIHYHLLSTVDPQQAHMSFAFFNEKNLKRKKDFLLAQQKLQSMRSHHYSAEEKPPLLVSSNGLLIKATPFQSLLCFTQASSSPFFSRFAYGFSQCACL